MKPSLGAIQRLSRRYFGDAAMVLSAAAVFRVLESALSHVPLRPDPVLLQKVSHNLLGHLDTLELYTVASLTVTILAIEFFDFTMRKRSRRNDAGRGENAPD